MRECTEDKCYNPTFTGYGMEPCLKCLGRAYEQQLEDEESAKIRAADAAERNKHNFRVLAAHAAIWFILIYLANTVTNKEDGRIFGALAFSYPLVTGWVVHYLYRKYILGEDD